MSVTLMCLFLGMVASCLADKRPHILAVIVDDWGYLVCVCSHAPGGAMSAFIAIPLLQKLSRQESIGLFRRESSSTDTMFTWRAPPRAHLFSLVSFPACCNARTASCSCSASAHRPVQPRDRRSAVKLDSHTILATRVVRN